MSNKINLTSPFWVSLRDVNATKAIYHQWKILENSGCIENFRIAASKQDGLREGWFFSDSDAYKWLDAAARIYSATSSPALKKLMDDFVTLLTDAQDNDGYLYTYNQIHFPNSRWENLLIEHEFYCLGHLIEACISHHQVIGDQRSLAIAQKSADLLVRNFKSSSLIKLDGHEEVEIALFRLYAATGNREYKDLASAMLDRRGKLQPFPLFLISQFSHVKARKRFFEEYRRKYLSKNPSFVPRKVPEGNFTKTQKYSHIRWLFSALTGKYFQMHRPIETQTIPVGHCVRFGYLNTAVAMRSRLTSDYSLIPTLEKSWERMVTRRMYVTGGLGSVPGLEGFGRDYELDPEYAYAETCAALASILWCWEMAQVTNDAKYSDLLEWQLYNAALPGMGLNGKSYLYNNPLVNNQGVSRREWFLIPCCPSKLSRILASLEDYIYSADEKNLWIHQYIGNQGTLSGEKSPKIRIDNGE